MTSLNFSTRHLIILLVLRLETYFIRVIYLNSAGSHAPCKAYVFTVYLPTPAAPTVTTLLYLFDLQGKQFLNPGINICFPVIIHTIWFSYSLVFFLSQTHLISGVESIDLIGRFLWLQLLFSATLYPKCVSNIDVEHHCDAESVIFTSFTYFSRSIRKKTNTWAKHLERNVWDKWMNWFVIFNFK